MPSVPVRQARSSDADQIVALWQGYVAELEPRDGRYGAQPGAYEKWKEYFIKRMVNASQAAVFVADDGGRLVGVIEARIMGGHPVFRVGTHGHLYGHYVVASHRGRGVGKALVLAAEAWFRAKALPYYRIVVLERYRELAPLYEAVGMKRCECTYEKFL